MQAGRWRLALAVASPKKHALELRTLAAITHSQPTESAFRQQVSRATATTTAVRDRLAQIDKLVDTAVSRQLVDLHGYSPCEACWRMLSAMLVIELRLENGMDESDRTAAVARLRGVLAEDTTEQQRTVQRATRPVGTLRAHRDTRHRHHASQRPSRRGATQTRQPLHPGTRAARQPRRTARGAHRLGAQRRQLTSEARPRRKNALRRSRLRSISPARMGGRSLCAASPTSGSPR